MAARSLGTLTLDLIAKVGGFESGMDKASRSAKKRGKEIEDSALKMSKALGGIAIAAGGVATALAISATNAARDIKNLSTVAGTSAETFQELTFGARKYGIEQDKLGDILKDTQDKVGEFLAVGGGPLKDFFDKVAPKVGVTASQFRNLSGPDALQLYVSSLEKANLSQAQMTFYMEALASDATRLLPLFRDNGKEAGEMARRARDLGLIMSNDVVKGADEAAGKLDTLGYVLTTKVNVAVAEHAETISTVTSALITAVGWSAKYIDQMGKGLGIAVAQAVHGPLDPIDRIDQKIALLDARLQELKRTGQSIEVHDPLDIVRDPVLVKMRELTAEMEKLRDTRAALVAAAQQTPSLPAMTVTATPEKEPSLDNAAAYNVALVEGNLLLEERMTLYGAIPAISVDAYKQIEAAQEAHNAKIAAAQGGLYQQQLQLIEMLTLAESANWQQRAGIATNAIMMITAAGATQSKKMFELNKKAAIANALVSTYAGAAKALEQGGFYGMFMAAAVIAAGYAQIRNIQSTSFQGGMAPSQAPFAGGPSDPQVGNTPSASAAPSQRIYIEFAGGDNQSVPLRDLRKQLRELKEANPDVEFVF